MTAVRPEHQKNAYIPIFVTLSGIVTDVNPEQLLNALFPMDVTGYPSIFAGMVNVPVCAPTVPVMVTAFPETVHVRYRGRYRA